MTEVLLKVPRSWVTNSVVAATTVTTSDEDTDDLSKSVNVFTVCLHYQMTLCAFHQHSLQCNACNFVELGGKFFVV